MWKATWIGVPNHLVVECLSRCAPFSWVFFLLSQLNKNPFSCLFCFRRAYLAACRPCRKRLPGAGLPAARSGSEAASHGACTGGISEEGVSGGQGSGGLGGQLSGCLLGNRRPVFHSDVPLSQRTAVCKDQLELLGPRSQIRTWRGQKQRPDQVAQKICNDRGWEH